MSEKPPVISVRNLGKKYKVGGPVEKYSTFRDALAYLVKSPFRSAVARKTPDFWALKAVSFDIGQGEVLGVIGRNGAGKSTLLKILARITSPTEGSVELRGRVGSLLEVGTGFHPELTGRENIFLSGSILGMKRREIDSKLDEIVRFSEVEKFLDTPVKRYSSGMHVRLAFAVAAHLEPEILLIDEVLAVGDAAFQKKCLGKMGEVAREGRTVVFVSHNMSAIASLCSRALLLNSGMVAFSGEVKTAIEKYSAHSEFGTSFDLKRIRHEDRPRQFTLLSRISFFDEDLKPTYSFYMGRPMIVRISLTCLKKMDDVEIGFKISSVFGIPIHYFVSSWEGLPVNLHEGTYTFEVTVPAINLFPGKYLIGCWIAHPGQMSDDFVNEIGLIEIVSADVTGHSPLFALYSTSGCEVYCPSQWKMINSAG